MRMMKEKKGHRAKVDLHKEKKIKEEEREGREKSRIELSRKVLRDQILVQFSYLNEK